MEPRWFWRNVDVCDGASCWEWTGKRDKRGYGVLPKGMFPGRRAPVASRYALELHLGRPLLPGMVADHLCRNPPCVNPNDLQEVPNVVNLHIDAIGDGGPRRRLKCYLCFDAGTMERIGSGLVEPCPACHGPEPYEVGPMDIGATATNKGPYGVT